MELVLAIGKGSMIKTSIVLSLILIWSLRFWFNLPKLLEGSELAPKFERTRIFSASVQVFTRVKLLHLG